MSTHKYFDKICCVVLALTLLLTVLFMNAEAFGIKPASKIKGYESGLFDTSRVHTVDIVIDDWDGFLETCTDEEYVSCAVVIDNETHKNVAIRAKGNTSLSNVQNYGNDRYSFKIEFDHYDSTKSYQGLDKLSLNNIIQDNTYMKDYLCYQMMGYFGVDAPLCSFAMISVNGEEWGLYLAVEGVEDAFLQRNYGNDFGNLYKPDSQSMGGGRGNGGKFNMDDWSPDGDMTNMDFTQDGMGESANNGVGRQPGNKNSFGETGRGTGAFDITIEEVKTLLNQMDDEKIGQIATALGYEDISALFEALDRAETLDEFLNGKDMTQLFALFMENTGAQGFTPGQNEQFDGNMGELDGDMGFHGGNMGGGMGSDDVKLVYTDDNYSSYSNIFNNAKTDITDADKDRLIASLKSLSENSNIEDIVNVEEVIRYFVVHNFVCNFDSYTGSMIHNYYLYEENGKLSMIPWDYNLAFGGFVGGSDATSMVNFPIDSPVSGGTTDSRPMIAWIFNNEEYTNMYHQYFAQFIDDYFDSGYFSEMIDTVKEMIAPYVESDPTKFCTYEEFEKGIDTLKEFCLLRAESVSGQLEGSIPSTSDGQSNDSSALINASSINISDMGSMNGAMGGGGMDRPGGANDQWESISPSGAGNGQDNTAFPDNNNGENGMQNGTGSPGASNMQEDEAQENEFSGEHIPTDQSPTWDGGKGDIQSGKPEESGGQRVPGGMSGGMTGGMSGETPDGMPGGMPDGMPDGMSGGMSGGMTGEMPDGMSGEMPDGMSGGMPGEMPQNTQYNVNTWVLLGVSFAVLLVGLAIALAYKCAYPPHRSNDEKH